MAMDEKSFYQCVGRLLRARRHAMRLTQAELAAASGIRRTSIANIESGRQTVPLHLLYQLAETLETDVGHLVPSSDETRKTALVTLEVDGRLIDVPQRAADFVRRVREDAENVDCG